jgi:hypothetical protein
MCPFSAYQGFPWPFFLGLLFVVSIVVLVTFLERHTMRKK